MLLDPAEQQLDLPARLVEQRNLDRRAGHLVGQDDNRLAVPALDFDAPQRHGQDAVALAGPGDRAIRKDPKPLALDLSQGALFNHAELDVALGPGDEPGAGGMDLPPPPVMTVA